MQAWKRIEPTTVQKFGFWTITTKTFLLPNGEVHDYQLINAEGSEYAGCIALTPDNKVIIARQYRLGPERVMDEIPGGGVEPGETPEAAAIRELAEETGYRVGNIESIGKAYRDAFNNAVWHYFLATDCVPNGNGPKPEGTEFIEVDLITIEQLFKNAHEGHTGDVQAVFLAYEELKRRQQA